MAPAHRNFHIIGDQVDVAALRTLAGWPAYTRYAVCNIDDDVFHAYVEMTRPVRPSVFGPGLTLGHAGAAARDRHRECVQAMPGHTWEVGSWEAGATGRNKHPRRALLQETQLQQTLIATQQELIAAKDQYIALLQQHVVPSGSRIPDGAGSSNAATITNNNNITTNNVTNNNTITNNNTTTNNTTNITVNNYGQEDTSYIPHDVLGRRLLAKTKGVIDTIKDLHLHDDHPENHNIYMLSSRRDVFEVFQDGAWQPQAGTALIDDLLFRGYRLNCSANASIDWSAVLPAIKENFQQWTHDMVALRLGGCKKQHVAQARRQVHALLSARRRDAQVVQAD